MIKNLNIITLAYCLPFMNTFIQPNTNVLYFIHKSLITGRINFKRIFNLSKRISKSKSCFQQNI